MASIYATGLLWLEQHVEITGQIGSYFTVMGSLGYVHFYITVGAAYSDIRYSDMPLIETNLAETYSNTITQPSLNIVACRL